MNFDAKDLIRLRWSLAAFVVMLVAGAAMVAGSRHLVGEADRSHRQLLGQQTDIRARLARARDEEREIRAKITLFQDLAARGVIGQEQRLEWVERIARIKAGRRLFDLQYEISPQKPVDALLAPGGAGAGGYEIMASTMKLSMQLLHEDDLLGFLADLRRTVPAHLAVRDCHVERTPRGGGDHGVQPQLGAECTIDWVTLREKSS